MSQFLIDPRTRATFSAGTGTKVDLVRGDKMFLGLNCFEPGQRQRVHRHEGSDKFYLIVSGKARFSVGEDEFEAGTGALVWAPAGVPHGVLTALERTVMMIGMSPPPG